MSNILIKILQEEYPNICDIRVVNGEDVGVPEVAPYEYNTRGHKHSFVVYWKIKDTGVRNAYVLSPKLKRKTVERGWPFGQESYTEYTYDLDHVLPQIRRAIEHRLMSTRDIQIAPKYTCENN